MWDAALLALPGEAVSSGEACVLSRLWKVLGLWFLFLFQLLALWCKSKIVLVSSNLRKFSFSFNFACPSWELVSVIIVNTAQRSPVWYSIYYVQDYVQVYKTPPVVLSLKSWKVCHFHCKYFHSFPCLWSYYVQKCGFFNSIFDLPAPLFVEISLPNLLAPCNANLVLTLVFLFLLSLLQEGTRSW